MKKLRLKTLELSAMKELTRMELKNVLGGAGNVTMRPTSCTCSNSHEVASGPNNTISTVTQTFSFATNNGSCTPNGNNTYNFGTMTTSVNGVNVSTTNYSGVNSAGN